MTKPPEHRDPGPAQDPDSDDGVDVSLIRWTLSLTPAERLQVLQANADALTRMKDAAALQR